MGCSVSKRRVQKKKGMEEKSEGERKEEEREEYTMDINALGRFASWIEGRRLSICITGVVLSVHTF